MGQNLARNWHETGPFLAQNWRSTFHFNVSNKKKIYFTSRSFHFLYIPSCFFYSLKFHSCQFCARFLPVSGQFIVAAGNWTLDLFTKSHTLSSCPPAYKYNNKGFLQKVQFKPLLFFYFLASFMSVSGPKLASFFLKKIF